MEKKSRGLGNSESAEHLTEPVMSRQIQLIYIGPNIPGGVLHRYSVFRGGISEHLNGLIEKCPAIRSLFVPVSQLATVEKALSSIGPAEHTLYREVIAYFAKGGK